MKTGHIDQNAFFCSVLNTLTLFKDENKHTLELGFSGGRLLERLIHEPGQVIDRETLVAYAWADRVVGPGSLNQQVYVLRKMLGDEKNLQIIQTVPRRGYRFNPAYLIETPASPVEQAPTTLPLAPSLPVPGARHSGARRKSIALTAAFVAICTSLFTSHSTGLYASLQNAGDNRAGQIDKQQPKAKELVSTTRVLSERIISLSDKPVDLAIISTANGYYLIHCSYLSGTHNTLTLHRDEINSVSDTRLRRCVE